MNYAQRSDSRSANEGAGMMMMMMMMMTTKASILNCADLLHIHTSTIFSVKDKKWMTQANGCGNIII
jgi:hypothetical protein